MLDDFFTRAIIAGIGLALTTGPLGCFIIWRRMAYFGDTMAHSALLGVALALIFDINLMVGVFAVAVAISAILLLLQRRHTLSADSLLGILSHATLSLGLVLMAFMTWVRVDLLSFLFGDILAVSRIDIAFIYGGGALILAVLAWLWRPLLAATVSEDIARAEGMNPALSRIIFMLLLAIVIAIAMKIVGILLITSLLIIPAATARRFASTPEQMAVLASLIGAAGVIGGLYGSIHFDTPSGPSIVVAALAIFILSLLPLNKGERLHRNGSLDNDDAPPSPRPAGSDPQPDAGFRRSVQGRRSAQRLYNSRPVTGRWLSRAIAGLSGAGKTARLRADPPPRKPQRLRCLRASAMPPAGPRCFCDLRKMRAGHGIFRCGH